VKVAALMHREVVTCRATDFLDVPARLMWEHDIGSVPVIDDEGHVSGMITDRDICMAAYTQGQPLPAIPISLAMSRHVFACTADDSLGEVERTMRERQIRRMPVIDDHKHPVGIVTLNDIARASQRDGVTAKEVASTLAAIGAPRALIATT
jgi:CBS domain-containing protein